MQLEYKTYLLIGLFIVQGGCVSNQVDIETGPEPSPLIMDLERKYSSQESVIDASLIGDIPTGEITLRKALSLALVKNPELEKSKRIPIL